jgi:small subunit ribosomal protein S15
MALTKEQKQELVKKYGKDANDTGAIEVQVAILTEEIKLLTAHMIANKKDNHSKLGLHKKVSKRRSLLAYLKKESFERYEAILKELNLKDIDRA